MAQGSVAGRQIRLFLVDGTVGGLVTAEILNWTGHILKGKRERLKQMLNREEATRTGVYILFGADPDTPSKRIAYIGQSDKVSTRLQRHDAEKEFWDEVVIVTSKDSNLTSAHVRYLEAKLVDTAKAVGRVRLENGNVPTGGSTLPEADVSDMDYFIEQLKIVLPVLGFDLLRGRQAQVRPSQGHATPPPPDSAPDPSPTDSPVFLLKRAKHSVDARAQVIDGEFTLLKGSRLARSMAPPSPGAGAMTRQAHQTKEAMRQDFLKTGELALDVNTGTWVATKDIVFSAPSTASAIVVGTATSNGRAEWKTQSGLTYGDWQEGKGIGTPGG